MTAAAAARSRTGGALRTRANGGADLVEAAGTRRRLQALVAIGWPRAQLARQLHLTPSRLGRVLQRGGLVEAATAAAARALYDELWDHWPAGPAADRSRAYARTRDWAVPMAWDDDQIDDPAAAAAPGWRRPESRLQRSADLAEDVAWLITSQGYSREHAAARLGVSKAAVEKAFARGCAPAQLATAHHQEGSMTMFDPVPRQASEYQKGAAFAHELFLRQADAGVPADQIQARHDAATETLTAAARNDAEREFTRGYAETGAGHLDTLQAAQRGERAAQRWEQAAERPPEREAG